MNSCAPKPEFIPDNFRLILKCVCVYVCVCVCVCEGGWMDESGLGHLEYKENLNELHNMMYYCGGLV